MSIASSCPNCHAISPTGRAGDACLQCGCELDGTGATWTYARGRERLGPISWAELRQLATTGALAPDDMVLPAGENRWRKACEIAGLFGDAAQVETLTVSPPVVTPAVDDVIDVQHAEHVDPQTTAVGPVPAGPSGGKHDVALPDAVPGYAVLGELGRGGMGVVYKAFQTGLNRTVALKMILSGGHASASDLARFRAEAEAVARLQHPSIVAIYDIGQHQGLPFFSLEFVEGGSLAQQLQGAPQPSRRAAELVEIIARAMHAAHERGIVHRDLKPANVLLAQDGKPKVTDFGLAKQLDSERGETKSGAVMGTPSYMAPEQAAGHVSQISPRTDVYALGAILFEMLTGRPPFRGESPMDTILLVMSEEPVPPSRLVKLPPDLETICLKCLQKEPGKRYASALALAEDLRRFLDDVPIAARPVGRAERIRRWCRRNPALAGMAVAVLAALVTGTIFSTYYALKADARARDADRSARDADQAKDLADDRARDAARARKLADDKAAEAEENARKANERRYVSDLRLVQHAYAEADLGQMLTTLDDHRGDVPDLRGFEWYYWRRLCEPGLLRVRTRANCWTPLVPSGDGRTLITAATDGSVLVLDAEHGHELRKLTGPKVEVRSAFAVRADGRWCAAGSANGLVTIWDMETGRSLRVCDGGLGTPLWSVAFSPDGGRLASGCRPSKDSKDFTVIIWDASSGSAIHRLSLSNTFAAGLAFSPDGKELVCSGDPVTIWDTATGTRIRKIDGEAYTLALSSDGKNLALAGPGRARLSAVNSWPVVVCDPATGRETRVLIGHTSMVSRAVFSTDNQRLVTCGRDRKVIVWDLARGQEIATFRGHSSDVGSVAFNRAGDRLFSVGAEGTLVVWDPTRSADIRAIPLPHDGVYGNGVQFSPDGRLLATCGVDKTVRVWDVASGREVRKLEGHGYNVVGLAFHPDGKKLASAAWDCTARVWDLADGRQIGHIQEGIGLGVVAFSPNGKYLASATGPIGGSIVGIKIWDEAAKRVIRQLPVHTGVQGLDFRPDSEQLAAACDDGTIKIWNVETGELARVCRGHDGIATCVSFSRDGKRMVSSGGRFVRVWESATGREILTITLRAGRPVVRALFDRSGKRIATLNNIDGVGIWDAATGKSVYLKGPDVSHDCHPASFVSDKDRRPAIATGLGSGESPTWRQA